MGNTRTKNYKQKKKNLIWIHELAENYKIVPKGPLEELGRELIILKITLRLLY